MEVRNQFGTALNHAPVLFATGGHAGLNLTADTDGLAASQLVRTSTSGAVGHTSEAVVHYFTLASAGQVAVSVRIPNGQSLNITVYVQDSIPPPSGKPIRNFTMTLHETGNIVYSWTSDARDGDWFQIETRHDDGTATPVYETTYGSPELPYVSGKNTYTLMLTPDHQLVQ